MITLKLTESFNVIEKKIKKAYSEEINAHINKNKKLLIEPCKQLAVGWISKQPEVLSLTDNIIGSLKGQFGIRDGQDVQATYDIITAVSNAVSVDFTPYNDKLMGGGLSVNFQPSDFLDLLGLQSGHVIYENGDLHWLKWLLKEGTRTIVVGYQYDPETGMGRSGLGTMGVGGFFRVPPQFAGTENNNFVTRALLGKKQESDIASVFQDVLG